MALNFERGITALKSSGGEGGNFTPFVPRISWDDGEEKYVAILNPVDEIPKIHLHEFIPVGEGKRADGTTYTKYEDFLARTTPAIGEDDDPLTDKGSDARERNIAVAVELEPIMGTGKGGRARPKGFEVKTLEFTRRIFDDDGDDTGEKEEVTAPVIGFVVQSPFNFFGYLASHNETEGPHEDTAFRIKRRGAKTNTAYDWTPYLDQPVDFSAIVEFLDGISYLSREDRSELEGKLGDLDGIDEAAQLVASTLLEKRLEELADRERYDELTSDIEEIKTPWGNKKDKDDKKRSSRKTQSARKVKDEPEEPADDAPTEGDAEGEGQSDADDGGNARLKAFERLQAKTKRKK